MVVVWPEWIYLNECKSDTICFHHSGCRNLFSYGNGRQRLYGEQYQGNSGFHHQSGPCSEHYRQQSGVRGSQYCTDFFCYRWHCAIYLQLVGAGRIHFSGPEPGVFYCFCQQCGHLYRNGNYCRRMYCHSNPYHTGK